MNPKNYGWSRRKAIKVIGSPLAGVISNRSIQKQADIEISGEKPTGNFVGITYDPYTHQYQNQCRAEIEVNKSGEINGVINITGNHLDLNEANSANMDKNTIEKSEDLIRYGVISNKNNHTVDDNALKMRMNHRGNCISGFLTRPGHKFGRLAFTMCKQDLMDISNIKAGLKQDRNVPGGRQLPSRGIPGPIDPKEVTEL